MASTASISSAQLNTARKTIAPAIQTAGATTPAQLPLGSRPLDVSGPFPAARFGQELAQREQTRRWAGPFTPVASRLLSVGHYLAEDVVLAAPVIVLAGWLGPLAAFAIAAAVYTAGHIIGASTGLAAFDRFSRGESTIVSRWLQQRAAGRRGLWGVRLLRAGDGRSFALASFLLGGTVTTWMTRYAGRTERLGLVAVASSAIFGVLFAAQYALVAAFLI